MLHRYTANPDTFCMATNNYDFINKGFIVALLHRNDIINIQVFGTPNAAKLLVILRKMLLIERDTPTGDVIWSGLETMTEAALKIYSEQQAQRVVTSGETAGRFQGEENFIPFIAKPLKQDLTFYSWSRAQNVLKPTKKFSLRIQLQ